MVSAAKAAREELFPFIGTPCPYCGVKLAMARRANPASVSREHVFPRCYGGTIIIVTCAACNHEKGNRLPFDWIEYLYDTGRPERAHRTIRAYCLLREVFSVGTNAEDVIAACDEMANHREASCSGLSASSENCRIPIASISISHGALWPTFGTTSP